MGGFSRWSDYGYMLLAFLGTAIRLRWARNYPNCFPNVSNYITGVKVFSISH